MFETYLINFEELLNNVSKEIPLVNNDKNRINKATVQHDIEQNLRELSKTFKKVKTDFEKSEKEMKLKQRSVITLKNSGEQLENRLARAIETHEKKVKREKEKKALISSVFNFTEDVGLHFDVCESEDTTKPSVFKIGFAHIDPDDTKKIYSLKIELSCGMIKVIEADTAVEEFKELEKTFNENFKNVYLPVFINRARKVFLNYIKVKN